MFETAEVGNKVDKATFKREVPKLREALLEVQKELATSKLAVVVVVGGVEGAGKAEVIGQLHEWMDARGIETHALEMPSEEERARPPMWRFWRLLPPRGRMAIFLGSWYSLPIINRVFGRTSAAEFDQEMDRVVEFEEMLSKEGVLLVKFWLHMKKDLLRQRMRKLEKDPHTAWRVTPVDWKFHSKYDKFLSVCETGIRKTNTGEAPWHIVEAEDSRYRGLTVGRILLGSLRERLAAMKAATKVERVPDHPKPPKVNVIRSLDFTKALPEKKYEKELEEGMAELNGLARKLHDSRHSLTLVFEGADAAGKGGAIRRLTAAMDPRQYRVISVAAPTDEEKAHPYLWRFWRHIPLRGHITVYDRSWYGRVLVERVEGFCAKEEWQRAYSEINAFEEQLAESGTILLKFWLTITQQEQLRRFKSRQVTPYKQYKITEEDWRNRAKWDAYEGAALEMIEKTSTSIAPWVLVEAEDKNFARIKVLKSVIQRLKKEL